MNNTDASTRRVFFALQPNATTRDALSHEIGPIIETGQQWLRWLNAEDWHVTLRFIGDVANHQFEGLTECVQRTASKHGTLTIKFERIELFPSRKHPLVLAATGNPDQSACMLVEDLESVCCNLGLPAELRPWRCHLTLARVRRRSGLDPEAININVTLNARHLVLMESVVVDQRRHYRPVGMAPLNMRG